MYGVPTFFTMESSTYNAGSFRGGGIYFHVNIGACKTGAKQGLRHTVRIWVSRTLEIAIACSVLSFAIIVRLLI